LAENKPVVEIDNSKTYSENKKLLDKNNCLYKGYFQSEMYFKDIYGQLKKEFEIKSIHKVNVRKF